MHIEYAIAAGFSSVLEFTGYSSIMKTIKTILHVKVNKASMAIYHNSLTH